jgi:ABC-2 type transport system ATP-binding protein
LADPIITLDGVSKRFGATVAVSDVSFEVKPGRCVGWLGPNGSGKTTLIRCMLGLARPNEGAIHVRGFAIPKDVRKALQRVGGIVEEPRFYPYLSGKANLQVWARFTGGDALTRVDWALERVDLAARAGSKVKEYSLGMRQRLGVARSLLTDPELLILDEPSNGLDPAGMAEFRDMIRSFVEQEGRTVFISSHLLDEVQKIADEIAIVQAGKLVLHGSVDELVAGGRHSLRVKVDAPERAEELLRGVDSVTAIVRGQAGNLDLTLARVDDESSIAITRALVTAGIGVAEVVQESESLEERFLAITSTAVPAENAQATP